MGAGRKHTLRTKEQILFYILFYVKCYPTYDLAGILFNVDRSRTCRWVLEWMPLLKEALGREIVLPKRRISSVEEFLNVCREAKDVFIDGTEKVIQRPKNKKSRQRHYSGKKKRYTKENLIMTDDKGTILYLSDTVSGRKHDYQLFKDSGIGVVIPKQVSVWIDLGFKGIEKYYDLDVVISHKRSKKRGLSEKEQADNKVIRGIRVRCERSISGIKRMKSVGDIYRNKRERMEDRLMEIACVLWNFHLRIA